MLTAAEIAGMQQALLATLPDTATVLRVTIAQDGQGGATNVWNQVGAYPCRTLGMRPLPMGEQFAGQAQIEARSLYYVWLPFGADVTSADRISIAITGGSITVYEVTDVQTGETESPGVLALCDRLN